MKKQMIVFLVILVSLSLALPAGAVPNPVVPCANAGEVWSQTKLLLPILSDAKDVQYSVIGGTLAQATFIYDGMEYLLRQEASDSFTDISGVYKEFTDVYADEEYEDYACKTGYTAEERLAWWFDPVRGVSGSLMGSLEASSSFDLVLYEVFTGLNRGVCFANAASTGRDGFRLSYPLLQTEDDALTAKINQSVLQGIDCVTAAYGQDTRFEQQYMSPSLVGKVLNVEWGGTFITPGAPYDSFLIFTVSVDCGTGDLAPLRSLLDADILAENTYPLLAQCVVTQDWEEEEDVNEAQAEYIKALTLDDWKSLLRSADFPAETGWPPAFVAWRDGGYYRDGNEEEFPCLIIYVGVQHALQDQILLAIPFAQISMDLMDLLEIQ